MAYRRRKGFKGTWFPSFGTELDADTQIVGLDGLITVSEDQGARTEVIALLPDQPVEDYDDFDKSLADSIGSEYALRRIVGKFCVGCSGTVPTPNSTSGKVTLGFFIARVDPANPDLPLGAPGSVFTAASDEIGFDAFSPNALSTTRQPWIFRRSWLLGIPSSSIWPQTNTQYGSVMDGPHIDAKTRRRVKGDERLFAAISYAFFPPFIEPEGEGGLTFQWDMDLRFFGALRKARGKGAF